MNLLNIRCSFSKGWNQVAEEMNHLWQPRMHMGGFPALDRHTRGWVWPFPPQTDIWGPPTVRFRCPPQRPCARLPTPHVSSYTTPTPLAHRVSFWRNIVSRGCPSDICMGQERVNANEIPNDTVTLLPLSKRNHPISPWTSLSVYHPDLKTTFKQTRVSKNKFFWIKCPSRASVEEEPPTMTLPAAHVPGPLGHSTFPGFSLWHSRGVSLCMAAVTISKKAVDSAAKKEIQLCVTRSAASPGSTRASSLTCSESQYLHLQMSLHHFPAWPKEGFKVPANGFPQRGAQAKVFLVPVTQESKTWTFPDLRKFRKPRPFLSLPSKVPLPRQNILSLTKYRKSFQCTSFKHYPALQSSVFREVRLLVLWFWADKSIILIIFYNSYSHWVGIIYMMQ